MGNWILPAMGTFICFGLWAFVPKITANYISPKSALLFETIGGLIIAACVLFSLDFKIDHNPRGVILATVAGMLGAIGALCYLYAATRGDVSKIAMFTALYPIVPVLLAFIFLSEAINFKQSLGIVFGLISMLLIAT